MVPYRYWDKIDEEALRVAVTIGLAELALSGVTTTADHHYLYSPAYNFDPNEVLFHRPAISACALPSAVAAPPRGAISTRIARRPFPSRHWRKCFAPSKTPHHAGTTAVRNAMRRVVMAPTTPTFSLEEGELREMAAAARVRNLRLHTHMSENWTYDDYVHRKIWQASDPMDRGT